MNEHDRMVMAASLNTGGGHVVDVEIPRFVTGYPPVIVWGSRVFMRVGDESASAYVERFAYYATVEIRQAERVQ